MKQLNSINNYTRVCSSTLHMFVNYILLQSISSHTDAIKGHGIEVSYITVH